jgi:DNA-3-methyladenine glycosylase
VVGARKARKNLDAWRPLPRSFYERSTRAMARALLGTFLVHDEPGARSVGRIVETEAYLGAKDPAAHTFGGETVRNRTMFGPPGHLYVYLIYGIHHCCNVVTSPAGTGEAVLLRALEPVEGLDLMRERRGTRALKNLCSGPGKLVQALGLGREHDGNDLVRGSVFLADASSLPERFARRRLDIVTTTRVGITKAAELPLRFYERDNPHVSRP